MSTATSDREIVIARVFAAPREMVWNAWTDQKHVGKWWGPNGFTTTTHAMDVKPGGVWRFVMHGPDGRDYQNKITFLEVARPDRLVYQHGGEEGHKDVDFHVTVTFEEVGDKTRVTMRMVFPSAAERERVAKEYGAVEGGIQTLGRLAQHLAKPGEAPRNVLTVALPSDREIMLTRVFNAPRGLVYEACSRPEHVARWWGFRNSTLIVCEMDLRPGGAWRFVLREPDGSEHPFKGVYREVVPPERVVKTSVYDVEGFRDFEALETMTLVELDGKTTLTAVVRHNTVEARDGHLHSGMEYGAGESYDRLEELIGTMK